MSGASHRPRYHAPLAYLPLVLLAPALWLLSEGAPAVPPVIWAGVAAVAAVFVRTTLLPDKRSGLEPLFIAGLAIAATHLLLAPGFPRGHDIITHLWGTYGFLQAVGEGNLWPRWIHHIGLGMPFLLFYPPLPFYLTLPFPLLGLPTYDALKLSFVLSHILSAGAMYFVVQRWTGQRKAALVAAGAYCFAPYHLLQSNYRIAVAEAAAMISLPLFFYYMDRAIQAPSRGHARLAALWTAILALSHPLSLSMAGTGMAFFLAGARGFKKEKQLPRALALLVGLGVLGVGLAGLYTLPVAVEGRYASITSSLGGKKPLFADHGVTPLQLLERRAWTRWQRSDGHDQPNRKEEMPFYFGLTLLVLLPLARDRERPELVRGLQALTLGALALTLTPLDRILGYVPTLAMLQFPWRFLAVATTGGCILTGLAVRRLEEDAEKLPARRLIPTAVFALLVFDSYPYGGAPLWQRPYQGVYQLAEQGTMLESLPLRVDHLSYPPADPHLNLSLFRRAYPEYFTPAVRAAYLRGEDDEKLAELAVGMSFKKGGRARTIENPRPYAELTTPGGAVEGLEFTRGGERITVQSPGLEGTLVIKEQYFPGWDATFNGSPIEVKPSPTGLMQVQIEMGAKGSLELVFSRTRWDRLGGILLSLALAIALWFPVTRKQEA